MNPSVRQKYETVIGLEVHLQLKTETKIFCGCANLFGQAPNTQTCPVCLGLPGTLPVLNKKALEYAIKASLAINCQINSFIKFDRKNYYYPDLPKGYQISQYDKPIARDGYLEIPVEDGLRKRITIKRAHLEEDAGKLIHDDPTNSSLVDYNRTGTPLMEIVTEPDLRSSQEAYDYLRNLKLTLQYLNVSDCDMEKGSLRCDANISIREPGDTRLGTKTELKNMNSFKAVKAALEFEERRQQKALESGERIVQETRLWDEGKGITVSMRSKEEAHDYRYFPEPDLVPFVVEEGVIEAIRRSIPELPQQKCSRFMSEYKLSGYDADIIVQDPDLADFFEDCARLYPDTKKICNWIQGPLLQEMNAGRVNVRDIRMTPGDLTALIRKVDENVLSNLAAKEAFQYMMETGQSADEAIRHKGLAQVSDNGILGNVVDEVIRDNEKVAGQIREGKESAVGFLVGQAMRKTQGKANPKLLGELIRRRLSA
jgi:aspartyl-tRNA(Asn)/glutamyl-tRNA(Gln) amidotransferase subunit B